MVESAAEIQTINTAWQIAVQEIMRMIIRDMYHSGGEAVFKRHISRIEEAAVDSIRTDLILLCHKTRDSCKHLRFNFVESEHGSASRCFGE
jgi:hypothetical protein